MGSFVDQIFVVLPILEGHIRRVVCFDNGSFVTKLIAVIRMVAVRDVSHAAYCQYVVKFL